MGDQVDVNPQSIPVNEVCQFTSVVWMQSGDAVAGAGSYKEPGIPEGYMLAGESIQLVTLLTHRLSPSACI
ncbi:hypothetical protein SC171_17200 [Pantoea cypripedii]|uniref:hypothetical protein n=1 Tax=Pantoea cypripedii TaxID=55209 RepID=UPI002FC5E787